eukprot:g15312.t1
MFSPVHSVGQPADDVSQPSTPACPLRDITQGENTPSTPATNFASACGKVLGGLLDFTPLNTLTRKVGEKRNDYAGFSAIVCQLFFVAVTGFSKNVIQSALRVGGPEMKKRHKVNASAQIVVAFLVELASRWEMQPDTNQIHMAFPTKVYVYELFLATMACQVLLVGCTYSYFVNTWNKHCPQIRLKKTMRFTKCDICVLSTEALDQARRNGGGNWETEAMTTIMRTLEDHYKDVDRSRGVYMQAKLLAITTPSAILVIAIDGSDQSSYSVPYFKQETKNTCKGWKMRMKLIGALVTGRLCHFFTIGSNWESGSNLTIQVLHSTLVELMKTSEATGTPLPRKLHLQLDNCSRENKNRFFIGYLNLLVSFGVFDVIEMHFGLKGHTHDEIDQVFSRCGVALRQTDAPTRTILGKHIVGGYKKNVASFPVLLTHLYNCGNLRDLLQDFMFTVPCVTKPQAFRLSRDPSDNIVKLQVQARGYENKWSAIDRAGVYVEGYMEIMRPGPLPDLRDMPPCPRKTVDEYTMKQHRNCFAAAEDRIRVVLQHSDEATTCDQAMLELEADAVDLEASSAVPCDWDFSMYNLPPRDLTLNLEGGEGGGFEPPAGGGGEPPAGGGGEQPAGL